MINGRFYTKDALSVWTYLGKHFVVRLGYASLVDELPFVVRRSTRRISKKRSSKRISNRVRGNQRLLCLKCLKSKKIKNISAWLLIASRLPFPTVLEAFFFFAFHFPYFD